MPDFLGPAPVFPKAVLPEPMVLPPRITLPIPSAPLPSYQPLVLPSAEQIRQQRSEKEAAEEQQESEAKEAKPQQQTPPQSLDQAPDIPLEVALPEPPEEVTEITIPGTSISFPAPAPEVMSAAVMTAGAASVASIAGASMFRQLVKALKPAMTTALKKIQAARAAQTGALGESDAKLRWRQRARRRPIRDGRV